jgi:hypothetical protein
MAFISELNDGTVLLHDSESSYNHVEFLANRMIATIYTIASILIHPKKKQISELFNKAITNIIKCKILEFKIIKYMNFRNIHSLIILS